MFKARISNISANSAARPLIRADEYDPVLHGKNLCCPNFNCAATLNFRQGGLTHGGAFIRSAHFAKNPGQQHAPLCDNESDLDNERKVDDFLKALQEGRHAVLNLNLETGLSHTFNRNAKHIIGGPAFDEWTEKHQDYATLSVKNLAELNVAVGRIKGSGIPDALDRVHVNFKLLRVIPFHDFFIGTDKEKSKDLMRSLIRDLNQRPAKEALYWTEKNIFGFPRLIELIPSAGSREYRGAGTHIKGRPIELSETPDSKLLMRHSMSVGGHLRRGDILKNKSTYVLAVPYISTDIKDQIEAFKKGAQSKIFLDLKWALKSDDQFIEIKPITESPRPFTDAKPDKPRLA